MSASFSVPVYSACYQIEHTRHYPKLSFSTIRGSVFKKYTPSFNIGKRCSVNWMMGKFKFRCCRRQTPSLFDTGWCFLLYLFFRSSCFHFLVFNGFIMFFLWLLYWSLSSLFDVPFLTYSTGVILNGLERTHLYSSWMNKERLDLLKILIVHLTQTRINQWLLLSPHYFHASEGNVFLQSSFLKLVLFLRRSSLYYW